MSKAKTKPTSKPAKPKEKPLTSTQRLEAFGLDPILEMIVEGMFYEDIAKKIGVPRSSMVTWLSTHHSDVYARTREARADKLFEDLIKIADYGVNDTYTDEEGNTRTDHDVIARSRLRVDTRKWVISKMVPKKYGDKLELSGDAGAPLVVIKDFTGSK